MYQELYFVDKRTGTFSDVLVAYGLAAVLDEIARQALGRWADFQVWLKDAGPYYEIKLSQPILKEWVERCPFFALVPFIQTGKEPTPDGLPLVRDYDAEWQQFKAYRQTKEEKGAAVTEAAQVVADLQPAHDFWVVDLIGDGRMNASKTHNELATRWYETRDHIADHLRAILRMVAIPGTDLDALAKAWLKAVGRGAKKDITAIAVLNPHQSQGQNEPKAYRLNTRKNLDSFWLLEYLKAAGLWRCAAPRVVRGGTDRKTYVLAPMNLSLAAHRKTFNDFSQRLWNETAVKMDCIAALLYTQTLLEYSEAGHYDELDFEGRGPEDVVTGFHVGYYKRLGRPYTMLNMAFLGLPAWTGEVKTRSEVLALKEVIKEHLAIVQGINEAHSDGYTLLERYRDFLSAGRWDRLFDFIIGYSHYVMSQLERGNRFVKLFTSPLLRRLLMNTNKPLAPIIANQGFQNVAYAIRHSTVIPQGRKARGEDTLYEVRYGLGMELRRKAHYAKDFIAALSAFMHAYNAENVQVLERKNQQKRRDLRTSDIEEIVRLVDEYGPETVCNLLVAFGYAREPREEVTGEPSAESTAKEP